MSALADFMPLFSGVLFFLFLAFLFLSSSVFRKLLEDLQKKERNRFVRTLYSERNRRLASYLPLPLLCIYAEPFFPSSPFVSFLVTAGTLWFLILFLFIGLEVLKLTGDYSFSYPVLKDKPIKVLTQAGTIVLYCFFAVFVAAVLSGSSPAVILSGLTALTAVALLVFKDSLLGLIAGIQLSFWDMVRVGDWIEMPEAGVDGDVEEIALSYVKVRNFDNTIVTVPPYTLISRSFKNWRGMSESGGRRIKRTLLIDMRDIHFCSKEELQHYRKIPLLETFFENSPPQGEVEKDLTNIGVFRAYVVAYLRHHPSVHKEMTLLVRQLPSGAEGLPLEIYAFTNDTNWERYEDIQSGIFEHLFAMLPVFGLRSFQHISDAFCSSSVQDKVT